MVGFRNATNVGVCRIRQQRNDQHQISSRCTHRHIGLTQKGHRVWYSCWESMIACTMSDQSKCCQCTRDCTDTQPPGTFRGPSHQWDDKGRPNITRQRLRASKSTRARFVCSRIAMISLCRGHANLLRIIPTAHDPLEIEGGSRKSRKLTATMKRARGDEEHVARSSVTRIEGELAVCRPL